eukprot:4828090-Pyramimonas_sp.AAC.1
MSAPPSPRFVMSDSIAPEVACAACVFSLPSRDWSPDTVRFPSRTLRHLLLQSKLLPPTLSFSHVGAGMSFGQIRVDTRPPKGEEEMVAWVNNLEKDAAYKKYSKTLDELTRPRYPVSGHPRAAARIRSFVSFCEK